MVFRSAGNFVGVSDGEAVGLTAAQQVTPMYAAAHSTLNMLCAMLYSVDPSCCAYMCNGIVGG